VADGDTVYGTGTSLYVRERPALAARDVRGGANAGAEQQTEIYRFEHRRTSRRRTGGRRGAGWLRQPVRAVRMGRTPAGRTTNDSAGTSAVRVLDAARRQARARSASVDGLGKGERIYSVRFIGPRGYVVTFKQTDPLYSLDLSDPAQAPVTGELKITGYSAHLQPVGDDRLIGIGQEADGTGSTQGLAGLALRRRGPGAPEAARALPRRGAYSNAEYDPHALLCGRRPERWSYPWRPAPTTARWRCG
jgi:hypothetical protein